MIPTGHSSRDLVGSSSTMAFLLEAEDMVDRVDGMWLKYKYLLVYLSRL